MLSQSMYNLFKMSPLYGASRRRSGQLSMDLRIRSRRNSLSVYRFLELFVSLVSFCAGFRLDLWRRRIIQWIVRLYELLRWIGFWFPLNHFHIQGLILSSSIFLYTNVDFFSAFSQKWTWTAYWHGARYYARRKVSPLDTPHCLPGFHEWSTVYAIVLLIQRIFNIENFLIPEENITPLYYIVLGAIWISLAMATVPAHCVHILFGRRFDLVRSNTPLVFLYLENVRNTGRSLIPSRFHNTAYHNGVARLSQYDSRRHLTTDCSLAL